MAGSPEGPITHQENLPPSGNSRGGHTAPHGSRPKRGWRQGLFCLTLQSRHPQHLDGLPGVSCPQS